MEMTEAKEEAREILLEWLALLVGYTWWEDTFCVRSSRLRFAKRRVGLNACSARHSTAVSSRAVRFAMPGLGRAAARLRYDELA